MEYQTFISNSGFDRAVIKSNSKLPVNKEPDVIGATPSIYVHESKRLLA